MIDFDSLNIPQVSGIYCIENIANGKIYIGSSSNCRERLQHQHFWALRRNSHCNRHLQSAYNKYGEDSFLIFILEECTPDGLLIREQHYLDTLLYAQAYIQSDGADKRFKKHGFNLHPTAGRSLGFKASAIQRQRSAERMKKMWQDPMYQKLQQKIRTPEWHEKRIIKVLQAKRNDPTYKQRISEAAKIFGKAYKKPILLYDRFTGELVGEYDGMIDCQQATGIELQRLRAVLQGRSKYTHDRIVRYKTDDYPVKIDPILNQYNDQEGRNRAMKRVHLKNSQPIIAYRLDGRLIGEFINANEAAIRLGIGIQNAGGIRMVLYGRCEQCKGYRFKYKNPNYTPRKYKPRQVGVIN